MTMGPLYYLDAFTDETMPCAPTLEAWAAWLAKPEDHEAAGFGRPEVVADGAEFPTSVMERLESIIARKTADGWMFNPQPPADADFFAEEYPGGGWDVETATDDLKTFTDCMDEFQAPDIGDEGDVAVCRHAPPVLVRFEREPVARCVIVGPIQ